MKKPHTFILKQGHESHDIWYFFSVRKQWLSVKLIVWKFVNISISFLFSCNMSSTTDEKPTSIVFVHSSGSEARMLQAGELGCFLCCWCSGSLRWQGSFRVCTHPNYIKRYIATSFLTGWVHTHTDPCVVNPSAAITIFMWDRKVRVFHEDGFKLPRPLQYGRMIWTGDTYLCFP